MRRSFKFSSFKELKKYFAFDDEKQVLGDFEIIKVFGAIHG
jgi:hypothetical protein